MTALFNEHPNTLADVLRDGHGAALECAASFKETGSTAAGPRDRDRVRTAMMAERCDLAVAGSRDRRAEVEAEAAVAEMAEAERLESWDEKLREVARLKGWRLEDRRERSLAFSECARRYTALANALKGGPVGGTS
jgi:hypothetical protein